jgi:hypothetical protein
MGEKPRSVVQAGIVDRRRGEVVDVCSGADEHGQCPRAQPGEVVPCAGHLLLAEADSVDWRLALEVGDLATQCPLRAFVVRG